MPVFRMHTDRGFTLLEVMVALSIMSIVLVAVYRMHGQTIDMAGAAQFYAVAPQLAQSALAEFELRPSDDWVSDSGDFGEYFPRYQWEITVAELEESELLGTVAEDMRHIEVKVTFNQGELNYGFETYRLTEKKE